jgi:cell division septation protein DedD
VAQDDYYYEIQLTNKQLVFYFMAGASGLILSFLAGVMVGRGVEGSAMGAGAAETRVAEEKVVAEQSPVTAAATPAPSDFSYPQRLESDKPEEGLDKKPAAQSTLPAAAHATPAPVHPPAASVSAHAASPSPAAPRGQSPVLPPVPTPRPAVAATPTAPPAAAPPPTPLPAPARTTGSLPKAQPTTAAGFAIQVGAFKDKASADTVVKGLKTRGFPAYAVAPAAKSGGLFTVRVGIYRDRADAEAVQGRLNDDKFKPYIIKQ